MLKSYNKEEYTLYRWSYPGRNILSYTDFNRYSTLYSETHDLYSCIEHNNLPLKYYKDSSREESFSKGRKNGIMNPDGYTFYFIIKHKVSVFNIR